MISLRLRHKVRIPDYYMCVLLFWYSTELLLQARFETFLGIPKEYLNSVQSYLILFLLIVKVIGYQRYSKRELIKMALYGFLVILVTVRSEFNNTLLSFTLFVLASKNEDLNRVIRMIYHVCLVLVPTIILLSFFGIFGNHVTYRVGGVVRYTLGFYHANTLGMYIFILIGCHFFLRFHKLKWWDYFLALAAAYFCYAVPNSMSAVILLILLSVVTLAYKIGQKVSATNLILYGLLIGAFACNAISIILSNIDLTKYPLLFLLDTAISSRFSICHHDIAVSGLTWFGQNIEVIGTEIFATLGISQANVIVTLDNSYCSLLLIYGIVMYVVFSLLFLYNMFLQIKKQRPALVIFIFLSAVYGVTERTMFNLATNIFLLSFADVFYNEIARSRCVDKSEIVGSAING